MKRVLVLSVSFGAGHARASSAIAEALKVDHGVRSRVIDTFRYANPLLGRAIAGAYLETLRFSPSAYRQLYQLAAKEGFAEVGKREFNRMLRMLMATRLTRLVAEFAPDAVVATHPFPLGVMSSLRARGEINVPLGCVVTDFAAHPFWFYPNVDLYAVASEELRQELMDGGVKPERVLMTGIPIDAGFGAAIDPTAARASLNVTDATPIVLLMSGGLGLGHLADTVGDLLSLSAPMRLVVVCGRNHELESELKGMRRGHADRLTVLGYCTNVNELMAAADILVSKPGGLTCAEALASGLPMVIPSTLPGPEDTNAVHLARIGAAVRVRSRQSLLDTIEFLLGSPAVRAVMRQRAVQAGRPEAAHTIAEAVMALTEGDADGRG